MPHALEESALFPSVQDFITLHYNFYQLPRLGESAVNGEMTLAIDICKYK